MVVVGVRVVTVKKWEFLCFEQKVESKPPLLPMQPNVLSVVPRIVDNPASLEISS